MGAFEIVPIPCLKDNYAYLVVCTETREAAVVDPSEEASVAAAVDGRGVSLRGIWNTHHHWDHTGGNEAIQARYGLSWVSGYATDKGRIPAQTEFLEDGARFRLGKLEVSTFHIPGHTLGAIAYVVRAPGEAAAVFTGDTMFHAGCGRLFEGTPAQMLASLREIAAVGDEARVFPGHEYTLSNLKFALTVEPGNPALGRAMARVVEQRRRGEPTVGTTVALEKETNPFMRVASPEIRAKLDIGPGAEDAAALGAIRKAKDGFKG